MLFRSVTAEGSDIVHADIFSNMQENIIYCTRDSAAKNHTERIKNNFLLVKFYDISLASFVLQKTNCPAINTEELNN